VEAERFAGDDEDIRALVEASRQDETQYSRRKIGVLIALVLVLVAFASVLTGLLLKRSQDLVAVKQALQDNAELTTQLQDSLSQLQESLNNQARQTRERQQQLDERQAALAEVAKLLRRLRDEGHIDDGSIPAILQPLVAALDQKPQAAPVAADQLMRGYDASFLQATLVRAKAQTGGAGAITIPLPRLTGPSSETAYDGGRPLASINFSVVLDSARRMPVFSALNLQRSRIIAVARPTDQFRLDPRVPPDVQLAPDLFRGTGLDRGRLVNARDIA